MSSICKSFNFVHSTRRIVFCRNAGDKLAELAREFAVRRAAVVMDVFFENSALASHVSGLLRQATGAQPAFHFAPACEPDTDTIEACRDALAAVDPDFVVVIGGGSAMDTAKVARLLLANPGSAESVSGRGRIFKAHASLLVAVPTTAGTGSEVSESAVAGRAGSDIKLIFRSQEMTPHIALLDSSLCLTAPPGVTATAGYDAVTHAVEAYISKAASVMSDPFAESALHLLGKWLPVAYRESANEDARDWCLVASCQAAIAFNSANLGLAHALAAPLGALHHVPHGLGNALALPAVTAFNEPTMGAKAAVIARAFGTSTAAGGVARLRWLLDLDKSLDAFVKTDEAREQLALSAMKSAQVQMNPRLASLDDMRAIVQAMRQTTGGAAHPFNI